MIAPNIRRKIFQRLLALFFIVALNFSIIHLMPGDPIVHLLGEEAYGYLQAHKPEQLEALRTRFGLNEPFSTQFLSYLGDIARGDLGWSYQYNQPVIDVILYRLKWTLALLLPVLLVSTVAGALSGCFTGWINFHTVDRVLTPILMAAYAVPVYCLALLVLIVVAFHAGIAPLGGMVEHQNAAGGDFGDLLKHMMLPFLVLVIHSTAYFHIIMRNSVRQISSENFVVSALAKGFKDRYIVFRHLLVNSSLPFITVVSMQFGFLVSGTLLVEIVFSWQGMGTLIYEAVGSRDYPMLSGCLLIVAVCVVIANAAADVLYDIIDPRVKDGVTFS
jgi:peptide/nickel transport system permease protein